MPLDLEKYLDISKKLEVTLTQGEKLNLEYLPRQMTGLRLKASSELQRRFFESLRDAAKNAIPDKKEGEADDLDSIEYDDFEDKQQILFLEQLASHIAVLVVRTDIKIGKTTPPFSTFEERLELLRQFDFADLKLINTAIVEDIANPTKSAGTSSSDGQPAKGDELQTTDSSG